MVCVSGRRPATATATGTHESTILLQIADKCGHVAQRAAVRVRNHIQAALPASRAEWPTVCAKDQSSMCRLLQRIENGKVYTYPQQWWPHGSDLGAFSVPRHHVHVSARAMPSSASCCPALKKSLLIAGQRP